MQYRIVPKNGDKLSALGFGAMRLPTKRMQIDEDRATQQIRMAIDAGINYIDTAFVYHGGESEQLLGRALAEGYREKVKIATKLPPLLVKVREDMERILDTQLKRLNTDHIDYYLIHALDAGQWSRMKELRVLEFLDAAKASGKIVNAGFSFHGDRKIFRDIIDTYDWTFCQIQYNFLDETTQAGTEGLQYAASKGIAVMIMEPLRGGMLTRKIPDRVKRIYAAAPVQRSAADWALRWVWNHPEVTVVLSGMNDESHITENLRTAETSLPGTMSPHELDVIAQVASSYKQLIKVGCTGCAYCMPCPAGVNIPLCFAYYNDYAMSVNRLNARVMYGLSLKGGYNTPLADASLCRNCGKCVQACPQKIAIPAEMKDVDKALGGFMTTLMTGIVRLVMFRTKISDGGKE